MKETTAWLAGYPFNTARWQMEQMARQKHGRLWKLKLAWMRFRCGY